MFYNYRINCVYDLDAGDFSSNCKFVHILQNKTNTHIQAGAYKIKNFDCL